VSLLGAIYDGNVGNLATMAIEGKVDGTVSSGVAPQRINFLTGETNSRTLRLSIRANGDIEAPNAFNVDVDGATDLYYNGTKALETTVKGIDNYSANTDSQINFRSNAGSLLGWIRANTPLLNFDITSNNNGAVIRLIADDAGDSPRLLFLGDPDGSVDLYYDGVKAFETTAGGANIFDTGGDNPTFFLRGSGGAVVGHLSVGGGNLSVRNYTHGGDIRIQAENAGGTNVNMIIARPDDFVQLYYGGSVEFRTADSNATDYLSGAEVKDYGGTWRQVGFLDMELVSKTGAHTIVNDDWGKVVRLQTNNATFTLPQNETDVPDYAMVTLIAYNATMTISPAAGGSNLRWFDGATSAGQTGNRTLAAGGVATVLKVGSSAYWIWGVGLS
jgi:hypothetical protein